jgi:hypothetical protein
MSPHFMPIRFAILGIALLLTACANRDFANPAHGPTKVAILSFVGRQLNGLENTLPDMETVNKQIDALNNQMPATGSRPGISKIYANSEMRRWTHDITDWGIDSFVVEKVAASLPKHLQQIPFAYLPADYDVDGTWGGYPYIDVDKAIAAVRRQSGYAKKEADIYVVVIPGRWDMGIFERPSNGIGITKDFIAYYPPDYVEQRFYVFHAFYDVMVLDRDLKLISLERASDETRYQGRAGYQPSEFMDAALWADEYDGLSETQKNEMMAKAKDLIGESLPGALREAGLIP